MLHRLFLLTINIFFPPLAVLLLTGPYTDTLINCVLFLCGVIPSHVHAFYISCTYFHRKNKVKKGKWPGGPKPLIFDRKVWYGGLSRAEADELQDEQEARRRGGRGEKKVSSKRQSRSANGAAAYDRGSGAANYHTPYHVDNMRSTNGGTYGVGPVGGTYDNSRQGGAQINPATGNIELNTGPKHGKPTRRSIVGELFR